MKVFAADLREEGWAWLAGVEPKNDEEGAGLVGAGREEAGVPKAETVGLGASGVVEGGVVVAWLRDEKLGVASEAPAKAAKPPAPAGP